jgi:hypothetical protein
MTPIKISESSLCQVLFDCCQSQVSVIKDDNLRHKVKQTFNEWYKIGRLLWKYQGQALANTEHEEPFEQLSAITYEAIREFHAAEDMTMMLALMKAYNQGHVTPIEDELPDGIKTERQLAELACN